MCSLISKLWVYRSRKYLFEAVNLLTFLLRRWQDRIPANPAEPVNPHHHVRRLSLYPATGSAASCVPETLIDYLSTFTQVSRLTVTNSLWEEWMDAFLGRALVAKYFGGYGQTLRKLELTRVYLNTVGRRFSVGGNRDILTYDGGRSVETFPRLPEHQSIPEADRSPNVPASHLCHGHEI